MGGSWKGRLLLPSPQAPYPNRFQPSSKGANFNSSEHRIQGLGLRTRSWLDHRDAKAKAKEPVLGVLTAPQGHRQVNSHVQWPLADKVVHLPVVADCACLHTSAYCLLECHPAIQRVLTELLLYTSHWESRDNPRQIGFLPSQSPECQETCSVPKALLRRSLFRVLPSPT